MSKITMQDIADSLDISRVTVWKAFNKHDGVSKPLREKIFNKAKEMGYMNNFPETENTNEEKIVSLIVSRPDSSTFWTNIIHRMAQELAIHNINLLYTYMPSECDNNFTLPSVLTNNTIQGAVILNISNANEIKMINKLDIPKIYLDTVPQINDEKLTGDLILLEGYSTVYKITKSVIDKGVKKIGFVGDINYAKTNSDRYAGFLQCMKDNNIEINDKYCFTKSIDIHSHKQIINDYLDSLDVLPDAFICTSDFIAHFLKDYFSENSKKIPNGIIITGYDGSKEYLNVENLITTAKVDTGLLGKRMAIQIIYRMEHPEASYELIYIKPEIIYKNTIIYN